MVEKMAKKFLSDNTKSPAAKKKTAPALKAVKISAKQNAKNNTTTLNSCNNFNHSDVVNRLAECANLAPIEARRALDVMTDAMAQTLQSGGRIELRGFGSLSLRSQPACTRRNPKTGDRVQVAARNRVYFRASRLLLARIG